MLMFAFSSMKQFTLNCKGRLWSFDSPQLMGIVNSSPESFYNTGVEKTVDNILAQAEQMLVEGAQILDIGGMSSKPGAEELPIQEEIDRVAPVIIALKKEFPKAILSIDTYRSEVADFALQQGADILNDISGAELDQDILAVAAKHRAPYICMHMQGKPKTMQLNPHYDAVVKDILAFFITKLEQIKRHEVHDVILDVGFGFGKTLEHNFQLLNGLHAFQWLEKPLLVGISRKSMICKTLQCKPVQALNGTTALHMKALQEGAHILRVHDVKEAKECIELHQMLIQNPVSLPINS
jgi:dihydropteroate synthase